MSITAHVRHTMIRALTSYAGFVGAITPDGTVSARLHGHDISEHFADEIITDVILVGATDGMRRCPDCWYAWLEMMIAEGRDDAASYACDPAVN